MMTDEADVRVALHGATAHLAPRPGLLEDVRRGGRARQRRRRVGMAAGAVAVAAAVAVVSIAVPWHRPPTPGRVAATPSAEALIDARYAVEVIAAWKASHATSPNADRRIFDDLRGEPRIVWSGNTPAGRAAIVTQQAYLHTTAKISSDDMNQIHPLWGFVADVNGKPTVVDDDYDPKGVGLMRGFFAGADRSVLIVLDLGRPMSWSTRVYQPDGRVTRDWHPLPVDGGAAVVRVPPGRDQRTIAVAAGPDYRQSSMIRMGNAWSADVHDVDTRLPWDAAYPVTGPDVTMSADSAQTLCKQLVEDGTIGNDPYAWGGGSPRWCAYGQTPDGRTVEVGDAQLDNDPSHVYFMLVGKGTVQRGQAGPVDPNAALPVIVKLPDAQGWVVARKGALLKYRTANGTWQGGRHNAALLPPAAARVWVDLGDHAVDVPLPG